MAFDPVLIVSYPLWHNVEFLTFLVDPVPPEPNWQLAGASSQSDTQESGAGGHGQSYFLSLPLGKGMQCQPHLYPPLLWGEGRVMVALDSKC